MSTRTKLLAENALMLGAAAVLYLLSTYTFLSVIAVLCVPVPFVLLAMRRNIRDLIVILLVFGVLGMIMTGPMGAVATVQLGMIGAVMGYLYQKRRSALPALAGGAVVVFLSFVANLAIASFVLGIDIQGNLEKAKQDLMNGNGMFPIPPVMTPEQWKQQIEAQFTLLKTILPTLLIISSMILSVVTHWLARLIGKRVGRNIPALPPLREWSFPRSLLYYYFGSLLVLLLSGNALDNTFWGTAITNIKVMLDVIFLLQGLGFCLFAAHLKRWKFVAPVLVVSLFIFPMLTYILSLLGIFDLGIGLRKKLETRLKRG